MNTRKLLNLAFLAMALSAPTAFAQNHYPAGVEGIKGPSLPPPGVYLRDYNYFYVADRLDGAPFDFDLTAYVNAPRLIWMTPWKPLGANYGMDILVPFGTTEVKLGDFYEADAFGLGDIQIEPFLLSWHLKQLDVATGYAFWIPTGDFDQARPEKLGKGFWSHMLTLGATWFPDHGKKWALSALNRYEIHLEQDQTGITPGQTYTLEWGVSRALTPGLDLGIIGYYQQQVTEDNGPSEELDRVAAAGPELSAAFPQWMLFASLRYAYEFGANDRPEGHTVALTLTKRF